MNRKVILISIDGMRPDGFTSCGNPFADEMIRLGTSTLTGSSVVPPITLPAHLSLFHSVPPERHGTLNNNFVIPVRPVVGLFEQIAAAGGKSAMFYGWEPLRDIALPKSLKWAEYTCARAEDDTDEYLCDRALERIRKSAPDFVFLYMVETDEKGGHDNGWMSEPYLGYISTALNQVKRVLEAVGDDYAVIVTADHGGHLRTHGVEIPEDMTIPMFFFGHEFTPGKQLDGIGLLDLAPTVVDLMGIPADEDWEGESVLRKGART